jgi:glucose-1-phosphate cytidylyltransferase
MKVVLFCGGYGMRMRSGESDLPKPMTTVGPRPLIWHVMRYYAHFGHTEFVLCLGYGAQHIKDYFLRYDETASNDFTLRRGQVELRSSDIQDWKITFVHTGLDSPIGERLRRVREYVEDEEMFLANYADVLTDAPLNDMIDTLKASDAAGALLAVRPQPAFHCLEMDDDDRVSAVRTLQDLPVRENGGYFVLRPEVIDLIPRGGDLVADAIAPLAAQGRILGYRHDGFWHPADTVKERTALEAVYRTGVCPWMLWNAAEVQNGEV